LLDEMAGVGDGHESEVAVDPVPGVVEGAGEESFVSSGDTIFNSEKLGMVSPELGCLTPKNWVWCPRNLGMVSPEL